ncbi:MAG TPA: DUF5658 family protein [Smithella sp.]|jgi:hypothetical protein|nr:DUF5658 family protein [Smithella sp.]
MVILLAVFFIILNILYVTTANNMLKHGGYEANPLVRLLMKLHLFIPAKILVTCLVVFLMLNADEETGIMLGTICCGIYAVIVGSNYRTLRIQAKEMEETGGI